LTAMHLAGHEPYAAGAAVARAAVVRHMDAIVQGCVQEQFTASRQKAAAVDSNLAAFLHFQFLPCFRIYRSDVAVALGWQCRSENKKHDTSSFRRMPCIGENNKQRE
jgi:hypothetical protein